MAFHIIFLNTGFLFSNENNIVALHSRSTTLKSVYLAILHRLYLIFFYFLRITKNYLTLFTNVTKSIDWLYMTLLIFFFLQNVFKHCFLPIMFVKGVLVWLMRCIIILHVSLIFQRLPQNMANECKNNESRLHIRLTPLCKTRTRKIHKIFSLIWQYFVKFKCEDYVIQNPDIESKLIPLLFFTIALEKSQMFFSSSVVCPNFYVGEMGVNYMPLLLFLSLF